MSGSSVSWRCRSLDQPDALLLELVAHRQVNVGVAAGDMMAGGARSCEATPPMKVPQMPGYGMHGVRAR